MAQANSVTMVAATQYLEHSLEQLHKENRLRTMHVDTVIADTNGGRAVGRVTLDSHNGQGTLTVSTQLDECTQGELLLLAGSALALYGQATDALAATDDDTEEK